ncbi:MAG: EF-hand domain-containing protein [Gemmata sp.]
MRYAACLLCVLCLGRSARAAEEQDKYEEQTVSRCAERAAKTNKGERAQWIAALEGAFPEKVVHANTEEEYATWFTLLAGKGEDWRRDDSPSPTITELFDKVLQRLELGPVPSIKRDEFARFTRRLLRDNPPGSESVPHEDADKVFRVLDRNGDGELSADEFTAGLKDEKLHADTDGNGRITKEEYRGYFNRRVTLRAETVAANLKGDGGRTSDAKSGGKSRPGNGLPDWFTTLDSDKDGQVALFEWRKGGRSVEAFNAMDLNGDGLLTREEYLRFVKLSEDKAKQDKREEQVKEK